MIGDIVTVAWKEWCEYLHQEGETRGGPLRGAVFVALGGAFIGWQMDPDFGRSWLTVVLTMFIAVMFVTTVIPDAFAGERERHTLETLLASRLPDRAILLGKVTAAVSYGAGIAAAVVPPGVLAANLIHGSEDGGPWFDPGMVAAAVVVAVLGGLLIAAIGVNISLYAPTTRHAHQRLGFVILALFLLPAATIPALPAGVRGRLVMWLDTADTTLLITGALGVLTVAAVGTLAVALVRTHRTRLIL
jgi:ABC-2 type transport system permease protein